jgi:hypothetical protein
MYATFWWKSEHAVGTKAGCGDSIPGRGKTIFLYPTVSRPALGPLQWVHGVISLGVQRSGREANHSPTSTAEAKNGGAIPPLFHTSYWHGD